MIFKYIFLISLNINKLSKLFFAKILAFLPYLINNFLFNINFLILFVKDTTLDAITNSPVNLFIIDSLHPGAFEVIMGNPDIAASDKAFDNPSLYDGRHTIEEIENFLSRAFMLLQGAKRFSGT